jgi:hypothetical protein
MPPSLPPSSDSPLPPQASGGGAAAAGGATSAQHHLKFQSNGFLANLLGEDFLTSTQSGRTLVRKKRR